MKSCRTQFESSWYRSSLSVMAVLLLPMSWLFHAVTAVRRWCYRHGLFKSFGFPVPVMVVGNITVGGTGKTPCVIELARHFAAQGFHPGVVSRGYGGQGGSVPQIVTADTPILSAGDEAVLLARRCHCPVVICADRVAAVTALLKHDPSCDLVISDDGLQHYRLHRDIEIAVVDGERYFGNKCLMPAGPLREPLSRLHDVDFIVVNGGAMSNAYTVTYEPQVWVSLADQAKQLPTNALPAQRVHAVAGIGHPAQFFNMLRVHGYNVIEHAFPDHHRFVAADLDFGDSLPVLMTAKDAVKCEAFADQRMWYLEIFARLDAAFLEQLKIKLQGAKVTCPHSSVKLPH